MPQKKTYFFLSLFQTLGQVLLMARKYIHCSKPKFLRDNTWVALWLVTLMTLTNHNATHIQRNKKNIAREKEETHL